MKLYLNRAQWYKMLVDIRTCSHNSEWNLNELSRSNILTSLLKCYIYLYALFFYLFILLKDALDAVHAWIWTSPRVKERPGGISVKPVSPLWNTTILRPSSSSWFSSAVVLWWAEGKNVPLLKPFFGFFFQRSLNSCFLLLWSGIWGYLHWAATSN